MRAVVATEHGGPGVLQLRDLEAPPEAAGRTLVQVVAAAVNYSDLLTMAGGYPGPNPPFVPGIEVVGTDVATQRPVVALLESGGYAELASADRRHVFDASGLAPDVAGGYGLVTMAVYIGLRHAARLQPGETVLVLAGAGGVGLMALQVARALGAARVIAVASTERKRRFALLHGADEAIPYGDDLPACDVVVDGVGGDPFLQAYRATRRFGRVLLLGASSGSDPVLAPFQEFRRRSVALVPFSFKALRGADPDFVAEHAPAALDLMRDGQVRPPRPQAFPLERAAEALALLDSRESVGKLILRP